MNERFVIEDGMDSYPATILEYDYDEGTYALVQEGVDETKPDVIVLDARMLENLLETIQEINNRRMN